MRGSRDGGDDLGPPAPQRFLEVIRGSGDTKHLHLDAFPWPEVVLKPLQSRATAAAGRWDEEDQRGQGPCPGPHSRSMAPHFLTCRPGAFLWTALPSTI